MNSTPYNMNFEFDYIYINDNIKAFSRIPPMVGDIVTGADASGIIYDYVITHTKDGEYRGEKLRVNNHFWCLVKEEYEKYKDDYATLKETCISLLVNEYISDLVWIDEKDYVKVLVGCNIRGFMSYLYDNGFLNPENIVDYAKGQFYGGK